MSESPLSRRDLLKRGVSAGLGAMLSTSSTRAINTSAASSGLALEYQKYDGLGLAELIAKKQISPLELLNAVRQRVELLNPKLNALCHLFFDKAEAQINEKEPWIGSLSGCAVRAQGPRGAGRADQYTESD